MLYGNVKKLYYILQYIYIMRLTDIRSAKRRKSPHGLPAVIQKKKKEEVAEAKKK